MDIAFQRIFRVFLFVMEITSRKRAMIIAPSENVGMGVKKIVDEVDFGKFSMSGCKDTSKKGMPRDDYLRRRISIVNPNKTRVNINR